MSELTKILLVDNNQKYYRDILSIYGYNVCSVQDSLRALEILKSDKTFDLVLTDIKGSDLLRIIRKTTEIENIPVIVLTEVDNEQKIANILNAGADDYIVIPVGIPVLLARINAVLRRTKFSIKTEQFKNVTIGQVNQFNTLTKREKDVLLLVTKGESNKSVADKLDLSEITVKSHLNSIFKKLNVTNRTQAVLFAMQMNLVENK